MAARANTPGLPRGVPDPLDDRTRRVLSAIVRDYIQSGDPVGSHAIARRPDVDVSSATVRAVMADLEEKGFLQKPHTSAGRIPTSHGFRYYVDVLLRVKPPLPEEREQIERRAHEARQLDGLMTAASRVLHSLTRHAGVVAAPRPQSERLQRIELLELREGRVLAVLVSRSGAVRNRLLHLRDRLPALARPRSGEDPRALPRPGREGASPGRAGSDPGRRGAADLHRRGERDRLARPGHRRGAIPPQRRSGRRAGSDRAHADGLLAGDPAGGADRADRRAHAGRRLIQLLTG